MGKFYRLAILFALLLIPFSFAANIATCADDPAAPGIYTLTANLSISGTCLVVSADNVTIDCAGYSITGGNTTSFGIQTTKLNTTIDNCTISNF
ncbi:MAG: hypothetical protein NTV88_00105, partial [Candidatus Micrarchaeota archaeon]|nr:hypothetical protein [Candidatus Micrarchaeota archaeon]